MWKRIGEILVYLLFTSVAFAQEISLEASVNSEEIGLEDTLIYTLTINCGLNTEPSQIKFPDFKGFRKLSQSQSSSMSIVIGGGQTFSRTITYNIELAPLKTGVIEIAPATVVYKGRSYQTNSLKVNVLPASRSTSPQKKRRLPGNIFNSPFDSLFDIDDLMVDPKISNDDIFLQAVVDKKSVYIGEEVVFSLYLYSAVQIYDIEKNDLPKFENAWVEDIYTPKRITSEQKRIGHKIYNVYLLSRKAVFPNKAGIFEIEPSTIVLRILSGFAAREITRQSQSIKIDVKPLPEKDMPSDFPDYNVGDYKVSFSVTPQRQPMDKPFTLRVVVEGTGNINAFSIPKLKDNLELRFYDPVTSVEIQTENRLYKGKKTFEYLLFAKRVGRIQLPPFNVLFFKPDTATYEKVSISGLSIEATEPEGGVGIVKRSADTSDMSVPMSIRFYKDTGRSIKGIKVNLFIILSLIFPLIYTIMVISERFNNLMKSLGFDSEISRRKKKFNKLIDRIKEDQKSGDFVALFSDIYMAVSELLFIKFGLNIKGITRDELKKILSAREVRKELIDDLEMILDTCELIKFAKGGIEKGDVDRLIDRFNTLRKACGE